MRKVVHRARYTDSLLPIAAGLLAGATNLLDPFGGTGKVFRLNQWLPDCRISAIEIQPRYIEDPRVTIGNALALPWLDEAFDAVFTSPTYANRLADHHHAKDGSRRNGYAFWNGEPLHPDNSGAMQWGEEYREFHRKAWAEVYRVLEPGGKFLLNISNHIRKGREIEVSEWHAETIASLGFAQVGWTRAPTPRLRYGANAHLRVGSENLILFVKKSAADRDRQQEAILWE